jgi:hypothetical protein
MCVPFDGEENDPLTYMLSGKIFLFTQLGPSQFDAEFVIND